MKLNRLGFEPEMIQVLLRLCLQDDQEGSKDFVGLRQAALYVVMYWCTARFEEAIALTVDSIVKRGLSLQVNIKKGKMNQERKLQIAYIHPNSSDALGNFDPVLILEDYLKYRKRFVNTTGNDHLFPNLKTVWNTPANTSVITLKVLGEGM